MTRNTQSRKLRVLSLGLLLSWGCAAQLWTTIGPERLAGNGPTGRVTSLAVDPSEPNHWLLGSAGGGIWNSRDAGASWTPLTDSQPTINIGSVAFAASNPKIIYAGTGEATYAPHAQAGQGVLKSGDGGATWTLLGTSTFSRTAIGAIRVHPTNPNVVVAVMSRANSGRDGAAFTGLNSPPEFGVQRSMDGGQSWKRTLSGEATALEVDPTNFENQYTAVTLPAGYGGYKPVDRGVYRSSDAGKTWTIIQGPWSGSTIGRVQLAAAPSDRNTIYASIQASDQHLLGLFRTDNAWASTPDWMPVPTPGNWSSGGVNYPDYCGNNCTTAHIIAVDPSDRNTLYAGGASLWRCDSCGANAAWKDIGFDPQGHWSVHANQRCLAWSGDRLITCTDGGVFSTNTGNGPWRDDSGGLSIVRFIGGVLHPTDPDAVFSGALDNGLPVRTAGGWQSTSLLEGEVAVSTANPDRDRMASNAARIYRSTNGGQTFVPADGGFDATGYTFGFMPIRKCPGNDDVFLSGTTRLQRSENFFGGAAPAWRPNGPVGDAITAIAFAEADSSCGTYAYGTASGRLFFTSDGGGTWSDADPGKSIPARTVNSLAFDPTNGSVLFVALGGFDQATPGRPGHLFRAGNLPAALPKWINVSPAANVPHNVVTVDPLNSSSVYTGTDAAVWHSSNGGQGWRFLGPSTGLPNVPVYDVKINPATGRIVAFTFGRGAYVLDPTLAPTSGPLVTFTAEAAQQAGLGSEVSQQLVSGGTPPYVLSMVSGTLPPGLVILPTGELTGTPLSAGVFAFSVQVADASGGIASQTMTLTVGTTGASPVWTSIGPSPLVGTVNAGNLPGANSGRIASIAIHPNDPAHWLAGVGNGGIWESHDFGALWRPISDGAPTLTTGALAFAPSEPKVIYAGTGEATGQGFTKAGSGMLKSTDGGRNWVLMAASSFARAAVRRIRVHPTNSDIVLATVSRGGFGRDSWEGTPSSPPFGVLKTTDGGATWTRTLAGTVTALEVDPNNFSNQFAAVGEIRSPNGLNGDSVGGMANGVYRSTDTGHTWTLVAGPWGASSSVRMTTGRIELAIAPANRDVLYASISVAPDGGSSAQPLLGLYRTDNAWAAVPTWVQIPTAGTGQGGYCGPDKCTYSHVISVDPRNADTLFAGGGSGDGDRGSFWRCTNCGLSPAWTLLDINAPMHSDYHAIEWAGTRLVVGSDGGVWSTPDQGTSWTDHNTNLSTSMFYGAALHPTDPDFILAGLRDFQVAVRRGSDWTTLPKSSVWGEAEVAISSARPDTDWMGGAIWGAILRTSDGGQTNVRADGGIDKVGSAFVAPVRKCPGKDDIFLTGTNRMWRTEEFFTAAAPSWSPNGPVHPYASPNAVGAPGTILSIAFVASDETCNTYAYGNRGGEVQVTRDGGKTWLDLDPAKSLPLRPINGLAFDPVDPNVLYAAISSFDNATPGRPGHVFKSTNAFGPSPTWTNISPPQDQPFNVVAVEPLNSSVVYAGSDIGLWRSNDAGATWLRQGLEEGMAAAPVYDIKMNPGTGRTVVFTYGRGAFALGPELVSATRAVAGEVQLKGFNLAPVTRGWVVSDLTDPKDKLPQSAGGVEVKVNGMSAGVSFISPTQVTFAIADVLSGSSSMTIQLFRDGVPSNTLTLGGPTGIVGDAANVLALK